MAGSEIDLARDLLARAEARAHEAGARFTPAGQAELVDLAARAAAAVLAHPHHATDASVLGEAEEAVDRVVANSISDTAGRAGFAPKLLDEAALQVAMQRECPYWPFCREKRDA
jgi:signal recognition particle GTPase